MQLRDIIYLILYFIFKQSRMNICVHPAFYYVLQHLALITIKAQNRLFSQNILDKISEKPSVYAAL